MKTPADPASTSLAARLATAEARIATLQAEKARYLDADNDAVAAAWPMEWLLRNFLKLREEIAAEIAAHDGGGR